MVHGQADIERSEIGKAPTGIPGLDEITYGGLPAGRPTLVSGGPGSGKTLLGISFLVNGAQHLTSPACCMSFEENAEELAQDVRSLGFDLHELIDAEEAGGRLRARRPQRDRGDRRVRPRRPVRPPRSRDQADRRQARRARHDRDRCSPASRTPAILRAELRRLFRWLRDRELTAVITGERASSMLTRQGLEEYVTDAVIPLDHRVHEQISTRRLRVVKYRGSTTAPTNIRSSSTATASACCR